MSALFFPSANALRLVLASGLVPADLARAPARGGTDSAGRIWLELAELPAREILAALARVGVQVLADVGIETRSVRGWAELVPLRPSERPQAGSVLFIGPDRSAAGFVARLRRAGGADVRVSLVDSPISRQAWIQVSEAGRFLATDERGFEAFLEQSPGIWVRLGWEHPLPDELSVPSGSLLLLHPSHGVMVAPAALPGGEPDDFPLRPRRLQDLGKPARSSAIPVRLQLVPRATPAIESFWVFEKEGVAEFWAACAAVDERLLRRLEIAVRQNGPETRLIVRTAESSRAPTFLPVEKGGYAPDQRLPNLFVPAGYELRPCLRPRDLAAAVGASGDTIVWLHRRPEGGVLSGSIPDRAFRPLAERIEYTVPAVARLASESRTEPFALDRLVVAADPFPAADLEPPLIITDEMAEPAAEPPPSEPGWLIRTFRTLFARKKHEPAAGQEAGPEPEPGPSTERRSLQSLPSPDALRHGPDFAARRRELEAGLFQDMPRLDSAARAARWATLAGVYAKLGNPADAAVCWLNAVWESAAPPLPWLRQWLAAECQAAKVPEAEIDLDRWLGERRPGVGRVVAAYATVAGHTLPSGEVFAAVPRILSFLDRQFDDVPLRSAWLARLAAARVCDGDALGVARWHDRLLARLDDRGPGLDLDEPSFLRFHGSASGERFQDARRCLESVREKVHAWIARHARPGRRRPEDRFGQWAGLIADTEATSAYADYMLAWGLGCLGERTQATTWAARARKRLPAAPAPRVDPAVHAVLADLFLHRIKDAQEGRPPKPVLPAGLQDRLDTLPEFSRYAVNMFREHSRILEPLAHVDADRDREYRAFWGGGRLGERLSLLAETTDPVQLAAESEDLLRICTEAPATDTVPRVVLTLLDLAPQLDPAVQLRVLDLVPTALDWLEPWLATVSDTVAHQHDRLNRFRPRWVAAAFAAAAAQGATAAGPVVEPLLRQVRQLGPAHLLLPNVAPAVFRALRSLGLKHEAETLLRSLAPPKESHQEPPLVARLGLAIGWFAVGNEDAGYEILNETGNTLYLTGDLEDRERTALALAYAEALGFAPAGIAHGRLSELFDRLGPVAKSGSTNRYFTMKPLQLIDVVVRSIVTEEFALGAAVRGWLDDDEFLIRGRIHRDLAAVLREQGIG